MVEVNILLAFLYWVGIALHPIFRPWYSHIFVLKRDVKHQLTVLNHLQLCKCQFMHSLLRTLHTIFDGTIWPCDKVTGYLLTCCMPIKLILYCKMRQCKAYKKLYYGRGTARCTPKVITVAAIKLPYGISLLVCGLLFQRLYVGSFSRHYHFWSERDCLWPWELLHLDNEA